MNEVPDFQYPYDFIHVEYGISVCAIVWVPNT
jgi:hypothetical protein